MLEKRTPDKNQTPHFFKHWRTCETIVLHAGFWSDPKSESHDAYNKTLGNPQHVYRYKGQLDCVLPTTRFKLLLNCNVQTPYPQIFVWKHNNCCLVSSRLIQLPSCIATTHAMRVMTDLLAHPRMFLVKFVSEASILPHVGQCGHILKTNRDTNLPNNCRAQLLKRCANHAWT